MTDASGREIKLIGESIHALGNDASGNGTSEKGVSDASGREIKLIGESINNFGVVCRTNEKNGVFFWLSGCG